MTKLFTGTGVAITTPFKNGEVDYKTFERHIEFLIDQHIDAIFVNGTTGEATTLTEEEKLKLIELAVNTAAGRVPVIAGTGSNNTQASIDHSLKAKSLGIDGIMLITPYYNKANQRGLIAHFTAIADAVNLPVVLYNVPARTNVTIEPETVKTLSEHPSIVALKDATNDIQYMKAVKGLVSDGFALYSGNDDSIIPFYEAGGDGVISVIANAIPDEFQQIYKTYQKDPNHAGDLFAAISPLIESLAVDINPMPIKALVSHLGYANGELRLPLVPILPHEEEAIINVYEQFKGGNS